jgi:hypothetical protein
LHCEPLLEVRVTLALGLWDDQHGRRLAAKTPLVRVGPEDMHALLEVLVRLERRARQHERARVTRLRLLARRRLRCALVLPLYERRLRRHDGLVYGGVDLMRLEAEQWLHELLVLRQEVVHALQ